MAVTRTGVFDNTADPSDWSLVWQAILHQAKIVSDFLAQHLIAISGTVVVTAISRCGVLARIKRNIFSDDSFPLRMDCRRDSSSDNLKKTLIAPLN